MSLATSGQRPVGDQMVLQWEEPDQALVDEYLRESFAKEFKVDLDRVFFWGGSQGTCFLHEFLHTQGENYGGGFLGECGCFNTPDPWTPSDTFKEKFRIYIASNKPVQCFLNNTPCYTTMGTLTIEACSRIGFE